MEAQEERNICSAGRCRIQEGCVHACSLSHSVMSISFATLWSAACQAPLSMGFSRQEYGVGCLPSSRGSSQPRDQTRVSYVSRIGRQFLYH